MNFAVDSQENYMSFMAIRLVERVNSEQIRDFMRRISPDLEVRTDAFLTLLVLGEWHQHDDKAVSPEKVDKWLPKVHVISDIKSFLAGTFQGVSH